MNYKKAVVGSIALLSVVALATPSFALANSSEHRGGRMERREDRKERKQERRAVFNEFGVHVYENGDMQFPGLFYKGAVTAVSSTGFTLKTKSDATFTVNTASAKIIQIPNTVIAFSNIGVGDSIATMGQVGNGTIAATVVFVTKANQKPAIAKGTVTAVNGNTVTVQTKNDKTVTVNTDANTQVVKQDGTTGTVATDVTTGSKVRLSGLWDSVLHMFTAIKIKLK